MNTESLWPETAPEWAAPYDNENDGDVWLTATPESDPLVVWVGPRRGSKAAGVYARVEREDRMEGTTVVHGSPGLALYFRGNALALDVNADEAKVMITALTGALEDLRHTVRSKHL